MRFRVIAISNESQLSELKTYEEFTGVSCEYTLNPAEIEVEDTNLIVVIWAQDNFDRAIEVGRTFYEAGVLTLGVFPEYVEERGCFDAQTIYNVKSIFSIVLALTLPVIYSSPISFDFNDIRTTLKDAERFYARFVHGSDVDSLISKVKDKFQQVDLNKVESGCINLYGELQSDFKSHAIDKINNLLDMMPEEAPVHLGIHSLPETYICMPCEIKREASISISFILAGKDLKV